MNELASTAKVGSWLSISAIATAATIMTTTPLLIIINIGMPNAIVKIEPRRNTGFRPMRSLHAPYSRWLTNPNAEPIIVPHRTFSFGATFARRT
ncbi:hypothetical protein D3C80_2015850 [compost metagenome]